MLQAYTFLFISESKLNMITPPFVVKLMLWLQLFVKNSHILGKLTDCLRIIKHRASTWRYSSKFTFGYNKYWPLLKNFRKLRHRSVESFDKIPRAFLRAVPCKQRCNWRYLLAKEHWVASPSVIPSQQAMVWKASKHITLSSRNYFRYPDLSPLSSVAHFYHLW